MSLSASKRRILVVDDEYPIFEAIQKVLVEKPFDLGYAQDYTTALMALQEEAYDLLIIDLKMSGRSGADIVELLRGSASTTPVIILSGYFTDTLRKRLNEYANVETMEKPFKADILLAAVDRLLPKP